MPSDQPLASSVPTRGDYVPPYPPRPPQALPVLEVLRRSRHNLLTVFEDKAFGLDLMSIKMLSRRVFICNSPDTVRHAFVTGAANFERKSPQMRNALQPLLGDGLFISDGETWRTRRRIVAPIIHGSRMPDFAPLMVEAAEEVRDRWRGVLDAGGEIDALSEMAHLTAEIICRTIFGRALGREAAREIVEGFREYQHHIGQMDLLSLLGLPGWLPRLQGPEIRRSIRRIKGTLDGIIDAVRASHRTGDASVIGMLLDATDQDGAPLAKEALRNEAAVIFMAGHETTANCLAWTWYLLSQVPSVASRFHAELDEVLGGRAPTQADVPRLIYTRAIIEEALRLYPPVPFLARETSEAEKLRSRDVPMGSIVMVVPWLLHRHRKYWEDPDHFRPERFLPDAPVPDKYVYVPFSVGPRVCAGLTFALTEAILCLATLAQEFTLTLKPGAIVEPVCRLTLRPGESLPMTLHLRRT
jgi:cytochrome P450